MARKDQPKYAPVAQLDRVPGYEPGGREFESLQARQNLQVIQLVIGPLVSFAKLVLVSCAGICAVTAKPLGIFRQMFDG